jgi:serine protease Do
MGVAIGSINHNTADEMGLTEVSGVLIERVTSQSAAEAAGLQSGDVITDIDGWKINSTPDFMGKIGQHSPGDILKIHFYRNGKKREVNVTLSDSRNGVSKDVATLKAPELILGEIGMNIRDLTTQEESRLPRDGVIVTSIATDSQIDVINMEVDFIITRINGLSVTTAEDFKSLLQRSGSEIYLQGYYEQFPGDFAYSLELK